MTKRLLIGLVGLLILLFALAIIFQRQIGNALFDRAVERNFGRDTLTNLKDGLHVGLCGTGSPMPNIDRAGPCNVVIAGNQVFVVDIGEGGGRNLALMGINVAALNGVFITHFHSDHIDGLGPLQLFHWTRGTKAAPLPVYGPSGIESIVAGFNAAYATDDTYRTAHHGEQVAPSSGGGSEARAFDLIGLSAVVFESDGLTVTAFRVEHDPVDPAVGYRFDYRGRSICISGDTVRSSNLELACQGVDLLVHEALQPAMITKLQEMFAAQGSENQAKIMLDIRDYHATPEDAADSAQATGTKMLILSHLVPPLPSSYLNPAFLGDARNRYDGELIMGEDGMFFSLPANSDAIEQQRLM